MATEKQYEFFRSLYDEESKRSNSLNDRAKYNLSLATFYSAFVIFVVEKLQPNTQETKGIFIATIVCLLTSFLSSLWGIRVSAYEIPNKPRNIVDGYGEMPMKDEDFFDDRIADYTIAHERNSRINNRKAFWLTVAGYALILGIFLHACYFILRTG